MHKLGSLKHSEKSKQMNVGSQKGYCVKSSRQFTCLEAVPKNDSLAEKNVWESKIGSRLGIFHKMGKNLNLKFRQFYWLW